ncbi:MAG: hypothetical protein HDP28_01055 [Clostridia bacterium]|nr:hypothetical protein [Clostridia bacterium]
MGFKSFLSNIFKQSMRSGSVLGGDYFGYAVTLRTFEDNTRGMGLNVLGKDEVKITKNDVKEFTIIETNAKFKIGNDLKIGTRYKVVLNDDKSFIIGIVANDCSQFESTFML